MTNIQTNGKSAVSTDDQTKASTDAPLLNSENAFKLAVFGANVSGGCAVTSAEGTIAVDWSETKRIAQAADAAGLDAMVPVARWKGPGGAVNFNDRSFETFTWRPRWLLSPNGSKCSQQSTCQQLIRSVSQRKSRRLTTSAEDDSA